jgi:hypothetical protein
MGVTSSFSTVGPGLLVDQFANARDEGLAGEDELARDAGHLRISDNVVQWVTLYLA